MGSHLLPVVAPRGHRIMFSDFVLQFSVKKYPLDKLDLDLGHVISLTITVSRLRTIVKMVMKLRLLTL